jgi:hypothetical protein
MGLGLEGADPKWTLRFRGAGGEPPRLVGWAVPVLTGNAKAEGLRSRNSVKPPR